MIGLRCWLLQRNLTMEDLAGRIGVKRANLSTALNQQRRSFMGFRFTMRVERETGLLLRSTSLEYEQVIALGEFLELDVLVVRLGEIRRAAWRRGGKHLPIYGFIPVGFYIFAELLRWRFPQTPVLNLPHFANAKAEGASLAL